MPVNAPSFRPVGQPDTTLVDLSPYALLEPIARWRAANAGTPKSWRLDALAFSHDGLSLFASAGYLVVEVDLRDGLARHEYLPESGEESHGVDHLLPTADGRYLLAGLYAPTSAWGDTARWYTSFDRRGGERFNERDWESNPFIHLDCEDYLELPTAEQRALLSADGATFAIDCAGRPHVVDVESGRTLLGRDDAARAGLIDGAVRALGGTWLVTLDAREGASVFDWRAGRLVGRAAAFDGDVGALSREQSRLTLAGDDGAVALATDSFVEIARVSAPRPGLRAVAVTTDARVVGWADGAQGEGGIVPGVAVGPGLYAADLLSGETWEFPSQEPAVTGPIAVSPDGTLLARAQGAQVFVSATGLRAP